MLLSFKVLSSMLVLRQFTVESLQKHSGINPATIRTVLLRKAHLLDRLGSVETGHRGGKLIRYQLKPAGEIALREEVGELFDEVKHLPEADYKTDPTIRVPLALLAAENTLLNHYLAAKDSGEKIELLDTAQRDIESARLELKALSTGAPEKVKAAEALLQSVAILQELSKAELSGVPHSGEEFDVSAFFKKLWGVFCALSSSGQATRLSALVKRVANSPLIEAWTASNVSSARAAQSGINGTLQANRHAIALMPLVGHQPSQIPMYEGIANGIWSKFCELPSLSVVAPSRGLRLIEPLKGAKVIKALGKKLNVDALLVGDVDMTRNQLRFKARLLSAQDGKPIWQHNYNTSFDGVFSLEEDISKRVSEKLQIELTPEEQAHLEQRPTDDSEAYRLYMEGRYYWRQWTGEDIEKAIQRFEQALEKDSQYALAYAGLADCHNMCPYELGISPAECFPKAEAAANRALGIDDHLAEAHTALSYSLLRFHWDWAKSEAGYLHAISLNPNYTLARLWYAEYLAAVGRFREAVTHLNEAQWLDPESLTIRVTTGSIYYFAGDYDNAIEQFEETLKRDKNFVRAHFRLGGVYVQKGMYADAIRELTLATHLSRNNPREKSSLGYAYAVSGDHQLAMKVVRELEGMSQRFYVSHYNMALIYIALDDEEAAFKWLEKAYENRDPWLVFLKVDPRLKPLYSDKRFRMLARSVGLTPEDA